MMTIAQKRLVLKNKFQSCKKVFAGWTSLSHPSISEIFCRAGFDFIGIDMEHSTISQQEAQRIIAVCHGSGSLCIPRIASHNAEMARRLLDSGTDGLIVPMVSTAAQVREVIAWAKYPPQGRRGFGIARAQGYGFDFDAYIKTWNASSILIVQIESIEAVENIEEILSFKEIDAVMIGPYDISGSLNIPGQLTHKKVIEASRKVLKACKEFRKSCGNQVIEPSLISLKKALSDGYTFVILASDIFILWKWSEAMRLFVNRLRSSEK